MADDRDKSCGEMVLDAVIKAVSSALGMLIVVGILAFWEFVINPSHNYSVYVSGDNVYSVAGLECQGERVRWYFQMGETWYSNDKNHVKLLVWVQNSPEMQPTRVSQVEVADRTSLYLEGCEGEKTAIAYVWNIDRTDRKAHLRVRKFEIVQPKQFTIPVLEGEGK